MKSYLWVFALLTCFGCNSDSEQTEQGTPVSGMFSIYTDEAYYPLIQVLAEGFMSVYPSTIITIDTVGGGNVYARLSDSQCRTIVTSKEMSSTDSTALAQRNIFPNSFHFANDAIALISKATASSGMRFVLKDTVSTCLESSLSPAATKILTDRPGSENNDFLKTRFPGSADCMKGWFAVGSQKEIIDLVSKNENEVGIVGWSYLSDKDDPEVQRRRALLNVIPYSVDTTMIYPSQSAISTGEYPLYRKLFLVTAEPFAGPATGFGSFVASAEGQRIIRLFGLAPAKTPPREIYIKK